MSTVETPETPAVEAEASIWAEAPEVAEEVALAGDEAGAEFAEDSFKPAAPEAEQKTVTVPLRRLSKVIHQRNGLREQVSDLESTVASLNAQLAARNGIVEVVEQRYAGNSKLLEFDATFMETFDRAAKTDPTLTAAAAKVKAAMTGAPIIVSNEANEAPQTDPAVLATLHLTTSSAIVNALKAEGVADWAATMVAEDVIREVDTSELPGFATPKAAIAAAKVFFAEKGMKAETFLAQRAAATETPAVPPTTGGKAAPATAPATKTAAARKAGDPAPTKPEEIKTLDDLRKHRDGRFAELAESFTS